MKNINLLLMTLCGVLVLSLTSCDPCADVTCENGGICVDGTCDCADMYYGDACETHCMNGLYSAGTCSCDAGYEGDACDTESRSKFLGSFTTSASIACGVTGSGSFSGETTTVTESSLAVDKMVITISGLTLTAIVDGSGFTIVETTIDGFTYTGSGTINGNTMSWTLNEYDPSIPETCVYTLTSSKQ